MIFLGPGGNCISAKEAGTIGSLKRLIELKLNAQEIEFVRNVFMKEKEAKEVRTFAEENGIKLSVHASYFINLCSEEKKKVEDSKKRILEALERGEQMGASVVLFHPGFFGRLSREKAFEMVVEACSELSDFAENTLLGLETTGKHSAFGSLEENIEVCKRVKKTVPVIDWAHLYARNGGSIDFEKIFEKIKPLGLKHVHSHFSGIAFTSKGEKNHLPISEGGPDFRSLAREVLKQKIGITIISESPLLENDSLLMKKVFMEEGATGF